MLISEEELESKLIELCNFCREEIKISPDPFHHTENRAHLFAFELIKKMCFGEQKMNADKYVKKPIIIEAFQWKREMGCVANNPFGYIIKQDLVRGFYLYDENTGKVRWLNDGDYVIRENEQCYIKSKTNFESMYVKEQNE
jgi:hypothetical protein